MTDQTRPAALDATDALRRALRGWEQRIDAIMRIARDDDDLAARLPVLDVLTRELVAALAQARQGLESATRQGPSIGVDEAWYDNMAPLLTAVSSAHDLLVDIAVWHRPSSVAALRKARDHFRVLADALPPPA